MMRLFDKFKKKEETKENKKEEINVQGWDAITNECERVYPNQKKSKTLWDANKLEVGWK